MTTPAGPTNLHAHAAKEALRDIDAMLSDLQIDAGMVRTERDLWRDYALALANLQMAGSSDSLRAITRERVQRAAGRLADLGLLPADVEAFEKPAARPAGHLSLVTSFAPSGERTVVEAVPLAAPEPTTVVYPTGDLGPNVTRLFAAAPEPGPDPDWQADAAEVSADPEPPAYGSREAMRAAAHRPMPDHARDTPHGDPW